jgi:hypothetical protein
LTDPAFRDVVTLYYPILGFHLAGSVKNQEDHNRLRAEMVRLFGEPRIGHIMQDVRAEP